MGLQPGDGVGGARGVAEDFGDDEADGGVADVFDFRLDDADVHIEAAGDAGEQRLIDFVAEETDFDDGMLAVGGQALLVAVRQVKALRLRDEALAERGLWRGEEGIDIGGLDQLSVFDERNFVANLFYHFHFVGNHQDGEAEFFVDVAQEVHAIDRADVALLVVDATLGLTDQDQRVAGYAHERGCALAILLNKRDAVESGDTLNALREDIEERMNFVKYAPVLSISALTGKSVDRIWNMIDDVFASYSAHITTGKLNAWLQTIREFGFTVSKGKRRLKLKYVTQTRTCPPQFTVFCNMPDLVNDNFERYLENRFRQTFELPGTPIVFKFKKRD